MWSKPPTADLAELVPWIPPGVEALEAQADSQVRKLRRCRPNCSSELVLVWKYHHDTCGTCLWSLGLRKAGILRWKRSAIFSRGKFIARGKRCRIVWQRTGFRA